MKRVVEEITDLDTQIGSLFEEGAVRGPNSDSSRRAHSHNGSRIASSKYKYTPSDTESSLLNKVSFANLLGVFKIMALLLRLRGWSPIERSNRRTFK